MKYIYIYIYIILINIIDWIFFLTQEKDPLESAFSWYGATYQWRSWPYNDAWALISLIIIN